MFEPIWPDGPHRVRLGLNFIGPIDYWCRPDPDQCLGPLGQIGLGRAARFVISNHRRRLRLGVCDAEAIRKLFMRLQRNNKSFFHLIDTTNDGKMRNVMWIHPRSKAAYEEFHDVVTFDSKPIQYAFCNCGWR